MMPYTDNLPLWEHQRRALELSNGKHAFLFLLDTGCGKSRVAVECIRRLINKNRRNMRVLIIAPVVVCPNWPREIKKYSNIQNPIHLKGSQKERLETFKKRTSLGDYVFVTNFEFLLMKDLYEAVFEWEPEILIVDELHRARNHAAKTTKQLIKLADVTSYRYGLTATPIVNSGMDLWAQFRVIDKGKAFGTNFFVFRARYFYDANASMPSFKHFPCWRNQPHAEKEFNKIIHETSIRVKKEDAIELPDFLNVKIPVGLSTEQKRVYKEMQTDLITFLNGSACTAALAITKSLRLCQIITGFLKDEGGTEIQIKDNPRLTALESLLEDNQNSKIIIWAHFKQNHKDIAKMLTDKKIKFVMLNGETSAKDRQNNIDAFQNDETTRVIVAQQQSASEGIELTKASIAIYYSRSFSVVADYQSIARCYRAGSSKLHQKVTRYDIVAEGTIDEHILDALQKKIDMSENILALREKLTESLGK